MAVPDPNGWFKARVVLDGQTVNAFVNDSASPTLSASALGAVQRGAVGLWVGNGSGWRGYLLPRLDTAGGRGSFVVVGLCWSIYHAPFTLVDWSGTTAGLAFALAKGLVLDTSLSYLWAQLSYRAKSL